MVCVKNSGRGFIYLTKERTPFTGRITILPFLPAEEEADGRGDGKLFQCSYLNKYQNLKMAVVVGIDEEQNVRHFAKQQHLTISSFC